VCGIAGSVGVRRSPRERADALDLMVHRGPDDRGEWEDSEAAVWLGQRRLAIVDLSCAGRQPLAARNGRLQLVCNGEIYNYPALRQELERKGCHFSSNSDSEAVLHAYDAWGVAGIDRLEGMFAFLLWDGTERRLIAARDRIGIKPLYYAPTRDGGLTFASEMPALLRLARLSRTFDPMALGYYLAQGYVPAPWSIWRGIRKLEPGHVLTWNSDRGLRISRYWEPPRALSGCVTAAQNQAAWEELFSGVVLEHLLADVPLGLFLSSGLDSTSLALALSRTGREPIESLTVSYPGIVGDEAPLAKKVAGHLGLPHRVIPLPPASIATLLTDATAVYHEPQAYSAILSMIRLCQSAAGAYKAVLAGDGGDEVFAGYAWYRRPRDRRVPGAVAARRVLAALLRRGAPARLRQAATFSHVNASLLHRHSWNVYPRFMPEEVRALLEPTGVQFGDEEALAPFLEHDEPSLPLRRRLQRIDLMTFCSGSILPKVDIASMAYGLEVRVPFLDRRIVEWGLSLPPDSRELRVGKPVLRDYLTGHVPQAVLFHAKQGFSLRGMDQFDWRAAVRTIDDGPLVREAYITADWARFISTETSSHHGQIWMLTLLTAWAQTWLVPGQHEGTSASTMSDREYGLTSGS
jgi:asparagine synthase (glutamine-hydrolysing)